MQNIKKALIVSPTVLHDLSYTSNLLFTDSCSEFHQYILELLQIKLEVLVHLSSSLVNGCVEL